MHVNRSSRLGVFGKAGEMPSAQDLELLFRLIIASLINYIQEEFVGCRKASQQGIELV